MSVKDIILRDVAFKCLGNSKRGLKELASDCANALGRGAADDIAEGTFLCKSTVDRVLECEENYAPRADTLERILKYCGAEIQMTTVAIRPQYRNKAKE